MSPGRESPPVRTPETGDAGRDGTGKASATLWQRFVEVNRPGPPEHSVSFRAASVAAVLVGIGACWSEGLLSPAMALFAVCATVVGNVLAYRRRADPWPGVKPVLAVCAIGGFVWFILTVSHNATPGDISTVETPLATLFAWVLSTHSFDVPSRRDVTYSLAGSTALVAVAAAQSVDLGLGVWVLAWVACCVWGMVAMWQSVSETAGVPWLSLAVAGALVAVVAVLLVGVLPAPRVSASLIFSSASGASSPVDSATGLTDGDPSLPAHAADPGGRTGVGGYLGFAKSLDTADRVALGDEVVIRVRATRPNYWVGPDLRHVERAVVGADHQPGGRPARPAADRRLALHHPDLSRPGRRPVVGPGGHPDLLPDLRGAEPGLPRRQRRARLPACPLGHWSPRTAPSPRPTRWARGPSTRSCSDDTDATAAQLQASTAPIIPGRPRASSPRS